MDETELSQIEQRLGEVLDKERREAIRYAIMTVLCTPVFIILACVIIFFITGYIFKFSNYDMNAKDLYLGFIVFIAYMIVFVLRYSNPPDEPHEFNERWFIAVVLFIILLLLTYSTELLEQSPVFFGFMFAGISFFILGLLGKVYLDIPINEYDEKENPIYSFVLVTTGFIAMAYGELFSSSWLWKPPKPEEIRIGAWMLRKLESEKTWRLDNRRNHGRTLNFLLRLKLVKITDGSLELTEKGSALTVKKMKY